MKNRSRIVFRSLRPHSEIDLDSQQDRVYIILSSSIRQTQRRRNRFRLGYGIPD